MKPSQLAIALLLSLCVTGVEGRSFSDTRLPVWSTLVTPLVKEPPGWTNEARNETRSLAFSPDDQRLAVAIAHSDFGSGRTLRLNAHVLIIDVHSPSANVRQFDLLDTCGSDLAWNASGNALLVCGRLLQLVNGASCVASEVLSIFGEPSGSQVSWLNSDHVVRWRTGEILDMDCKRSGAWPLEPNWQIAAVAASSQGWVLLEHPEKATPSWGCEYSAVDLASHRALNGWPIRTSRCGIHIAVAVGAEALCFNVDENLHCRAINGAAEIPVPKQARGYQLNQAAISSARVVADRWEYDRDPWWSLPLIFWIPYPGSPPLPRKRAVFDLRSQTWISSWKPRIQDARSPYITDHPYHCALSSSGEFLAESGDGGVTLYRFAP